MVFIFQHYCTLEISTGWVTAPISNDICCIHVPPTYSSFQAVSIPMLFVALLFHPRRSSAQKPTIIWHSQVSRSSPINYSNESRRGAVKVRRPTLDIHSVWQGFDRPMSELHKCKKLKQKSIKWPSKNVPLRSLNLAFWRQITGIRADDVRRKLRGRQSKSNVFIPSSK